MAFQEDVQHEFVDGGGSALLEEEADFRGFKARDFEEFLGKVLAVDELLFEFFLESSFFLEAEGGEDGLIKLLDSPSSFELNSLDVFSLFFELDDGYSFCFLNLNFLHLFLLLFLFSFIFRFDEGRDFCKMFNSKRF